MKCADLEILLCDYVDGTLDGEQNAAVEQHLAACATCAQLARDVSTAVVFTAEVEPVTPPDELITHLLFQVPKAKAHGVRGGWRGMLSRWMEPVLQPRFAMGMAMTILSFSLLARFAGIPERQLTPADLHPARVWATVDDRAHATWDRLVKYYNSLKVVYEIQSRLSEWNEEDVAVAEEPPAPVPDQNEISPIKPANPGLAGEGSVVR